MAQTQSDLQQTSLPAKTRRFPFLLLAVCLAWGPSVAGEFVWLDHAEIKFGRARVLDRQDFKAVWSQSLDQYLERNEGTLNASGGYFRPLYCLSLSLDWLLSSGQPGWFHIENLLWHALVAWLLYRLGCAMFEAERHGEIVAFWAAAAFAVHPMCSQSVAWICGRKDLLCAAGGLGSLLLFVQSRRLPDTDGDRAGLRWQAWLPVIFSPMLLAIAILSKELAYIVPAIATFWFWFRPENVKVNWFRKRAGQDQNDPEDDDLDVYQTGFRIPMVSTPGRGIVCLVLLWSVAAVGLAYRSAVISTPANDAGADFIARLGLGEKHPAKTFQGNAEISTGLLARYARNSVLPLSPTIVDRWPTATGTTIGRTVAVVTSLVLLWVAWLVWRRSLIGFAAAWFVIWMLPASNLVPLRHLYAERYMYPALWGAVAVLSLLFFRRMPVVTGDPVVRRKRVMAFGFVTFLCAISFDQTKYWQDNKALFEHATSQDPNYVEGNVGLAKEAMEKPDAEGYSAAIEFAQRAIDSMDQPGYQSYGSPFVNYHTLGFAHYYQKQYEPAKAAFQEAVKARPNNVAGHFHLGQVAMGQRDLKAAEEHFKTALQMQPGHVLTRSNLGVIYLQTNRAREAIEILNPLIIAEPRNPTNRLNLGNAFLVTRDYKRAEFHFRAITDDITPSSATAHAKLALALWRQGRRHSGLKAIKRATDLDAENPDVELVGKLILNEEIQTRLRAGSLRPGRKPPGGNAKQGSANPDK